MTKFLRTQAAIGLLAAALSLPMGGQAGAQTLVVGDIIMGGWSFCPRGTAEANGALLAPGQNDALFSLYGTLYGGDGRRTFALPDMRGRAPMHSGTGPGLISRSLGARIGVEQVRLSSSQLPSHTHVLSGTVTGQVLGSSSTASATVPLNQTYGVTQNPSYGPQTDTAMGANSASVTVDGTTSSAGNGQAVGIRDPYMVIRYCVVLQGIYPSRN
ncbi:MAG: tail fiber protein [Pseudomonadota bacterium]